MKGRLKVGERGFETKPPFAKKKKRTMRPIGAFFANSCAHVHNEKNQRPHTRHTKNGGMREFGSGIKPNQQHHVCNCVGKGMGLGPWAANLAVPPGSRKDLVVLAPHQRCGGNLTFLLWKQTDKRQFSRHFWNAPK